MIPLKDTVPMRRFPWVNTIFILLNIAVFIFELTLGTNLNSFFSSYAVIPTNFLAFKSISFSRLFPLVSSAFLHGGWLHIGGNMLYLFIFGDNIEDAMGHWLYLFFYILVAVASSLAHIYTNAASSVPSLGASGAIAGVLGAYIFLYPRARVVTLIFLIFFFQIIEVPAFIFLGLWFLLQIISGAASLSKTSPGGIAWFAHIGGFISGLALILFFRRRGSIETAKYY